MVFYSIPDSKFIRFVDRCDFCGWIDGAALDRWAESAFKEQLTKRAQNIAVAAETEPFAFVQREGEGLSIEEICFQALGSASMCWIGGTGSAEFDSLRAKAIGEALVREVKRAIGYAMKCVDPPVW